MSKPKKDSKLDIPDTIFKSLLTPSELRMLKNRFQIAKLLEQGLTIRKIAGEVKVGTDTVVRVARMAEKKEVREAIKLPFKTKTPWIFGKSND